MFSPLSAIVSTLLLLASNLPTVHAKTCTAGDIALKDPRVTVGSDGSLTLSGKLKFASSQADSAVTAVVSVMGQSFDPIDVDLCQDATFADGSDCASGCPCTSYSGVSIDLGDDLIPDPYKSMIATYVPSGISFKVSADIYQNDQLLNSCSVGVRSASASFVSMGAVVLLLGLGGGAGMLARRRRRRIAMEAEACTSSFVEMADGRVAGGATMA